MNARRPVATSRGVQAGHRRKPACLSPARLTLANSSSPCSRGEVEPSVRTVHGTHFLFRSAVADPSRSPTNTRGQQFVKNGGIVGHLLPLRGANVSSATARMSPENRGRHGDARGSLWSPCTASSCCWRPARRAHPPTSGKRTCSHATRRSPSEARERQRCGSHCAPCAGRGSPDRAMVGRSAGSSSRWRRAAGRRNGSIPTVESARRDTSGNCAMTVARLRAEEAYR
jgi:hypothetical protein